MTNSEIVIDLPLYLEDFLRGEYNCPTGAVKLDSISIIGMVANALTLHKNTPAKPIVRNNPVKLILPQSPFINSDYNFAYLPREHERKIVMAIKSQFKIKTEYYFLVGYRAGFKQKDIIYAFLDRYNMGKSGINFDAIKKNDFRQRIKIRKLITENVEAFEKQHNKK